LRRVSLVLVLIALGAIAWPGTAAAARASDDDGDAVVVISGDVTVPRGETVGDVFVIDGDVAFRGHAEGDVVLVSGDAVVAGKIDGDLVTLAGEARLLPSAVVGGDVRYGDEHPQVSADARVRGNVSSEDWPRSLDLLPFVGAFLLWLAVGLSAAVLGLGLIGAAIGAAREGQPQPARSQSR
jgi:hypothetical protein